MQGAAPAHPRQPAEKPFVQQFGHPDRRQRPQVGIRDVRELEHGCLGRGGAERLTKLEEHVIKTRGSVKALIRQGVLTRSEEHTSELQSLMRNSYAVFCLKKKNKTQVSTP